MTRFMSIALAVGACAPAEAPLRPARPPVVAVGEAASAPKEVPPGTHPPEKEVVADYEPCTATMFDHENGLHDRFVFEDTTGLFGFRNAAGEIVIYPRFLHAYAFTPGGIAAVIDGDARPAFIDTSGRVIAEAFFYDNGPDYFTERRARIVVDGKVGFIDERGSIIVRPAYDWASAFCHGLSVVCVGCVKTPGEHGAWVGGSWGFVDPVERVAVPLRFEAVEERFDPDEAVVVLDGRAVRIDREGRLLGERE